MEPTRHMDYISDERICALETLQDALLMCWKVTGKDAKEVAYEVGIDYAHFIRMFEKNDSRHFPPKKIIKLMEVSGNTIPLRWLALKLGYGIHVLKSRAEMELDAFKVKYRAEQAQWEKEKAALLAQIVGDIAAAPVKSPIRPRAAFSLGPCLAVPEWMKREAEAIYCRLRQAA